MKVILAAKHGTELELGYKTAHLTGVDTALLAANVLPGDVSNLHADLTELMASKEYKAWANPAPLAKKTSKPVKKHAKPVPKAPSTAKRAVAGKAQNATSTRSVSKKPSASTETNSRHGSGTLSESPESHVNAMPVNERPRTGSMTTAEQDEAVLEAGGTITLPPTSEAPEGFAAHTDHAMEHAKAVKTNVRRGRPRKTRPTVAGEVAEG